ncbi:tetratricopeptide repeat protein 38 isoform X1 [Senna tora]|uniref:Tetratricopeptide repeat protein 38 isoform X1 n=1 Tax=Senna tora TaxID=362788 RepID=A0A834W4K9_9FABA|nr:tetratricopeptide repeat protein 38 isoform X1 [Senna tora]
MEGGVKLDGWGYEVKTSSDACISAINAYYHQVLSYGRERSVILKAPDHDEACVLANILAAHYLYHSDPSRATSFLEAAKSHLEQATLYERLVYDALSYLVSEDRDDDVAFELHRKLLKEFPRDLSSLKRAQILCFYMGRPDLSLSLVHQLKLAKAQWSFATISHSAGLRNKMDQISAFEKEFVAGRHSLFSPENISDLRKRLENNEEELRRKDKVISELEAKLDVAKLSDNSQAQIDDISSPTWNSYWIKGYSVPYCNIKKKLERTWRWKKLVNKSSFGKFISPRVGVGDIAQNEEKDQELTGSPS